MKVHLRLDGQSRTLEAAPLRIDRGDDDDRILRQLARSLDLPDQSLRGAVIDRNPDGIVVRPPAVFG